MSIFEDELPNAAGERGVVEMSRLVNAYTISPDEIKPGDELLFVVKAMVVRKDKNGKLHYRLYRCKWEGDVYSIPQGARIYDAEGVCRALFPSLVEVGEEDHR